jgi:arabinofuranosyltransferase
VKPSVPIVLFLAAAACRIFLWLLTGYSVDDAFITFRYAENIAAGNGFVYNLGERVLGTTTPLFTLLLAAFNVFGISSLTAALLISLMAAGLTAVVLYRWSRALGLGTMAILPAVLYIAFPRSLICDICGMETAVFALLVTAGLYLLYARRFLPAMIVASLATVTRPEGWALLALVTIISIIHDRRQFLVGVIPVVLIAGSWSIFAQFYFGSLIPNSLMAKLALYPAGTGAGIWQNTVVALGVGSPIGWIVWVLFALGGILASRKGMIMGIIFLWSLAYLGALIVGGGHVFFWYPAPVFPAVFAFVGYATAWLLSYLSFRPSTLAAATTVVILVISAAYLYRSTDGLKNEMAIYHGDHAAAGEYVRAHGGKADKVLAEDIGYFGYVYRGRIIDRDGLVTPQAIAYNRAGRYRQFADSVAADWVFLDAIYPTSREILAAGDFGARYGEITLPNQGATASHRLYHRVGTP